MDVSKLEGEAQLEELRRRAAKNFEKYNEAKAEPTSAPRQRPHQRTPTEAPRAEEQACPVGEVDSPRGLVGAGPISVRG